ncbi:CobW family GTP-binding protein [Gymnodinialimonas sp. 2307UL20-7]
MTVIAGYLGAGKTTLINRLLAAPHGLKLLVMVNDFGAINIDESLLISRDEDTIALSNGCVCCTMGADLFMAIGDVLDRASRPDHLIIEASGVSDPARIANVALAEPDLRYGGIVTVVDGQSFADLHRDALIGPQVTAQIAKADLIWVSKEPDAGHAAAIATLTDAPMVRDAAPDTLLSLVTDTPPQTAPESHASHTSWACDGVFAGDLHALRQALATRPTGLFRVKGVVLDASGQRWVVQVVGQQINVTAAKDGAKPGLVGIGLAAHLDKAAVEAWWPANRHSGLR